MIPVRCDTPLCVEAMPEDDEWVLEKPLVWECDGMALTVPKGFITDLASIPRALRNILSVTGKSRRASVPHDWLYCAKKTTRAEADEFLRLALICEGMSAFAARTYWLGVRAGGARYWNRRSGLLPSDFADGSIADGLQL